MATRAQKVGELLVRERVIDELQLRSALSQHEQWGGRVANVIAEMGLATEDRVVESLSRALGIQRIKLGGIQKDPGALAKLDVGFVEQHGVFPVQLRDDGKVLLLAMADPTDLETVDEVGRRARARVTLYIAGEKEIQHAILRHYRGLDPAQMAPRKTGPAVPAADLDEDEEEFKIVDMSGNTVMKRLSDIDPRLAEAEAPERTAPPIELPTGPASTADLLDDILGGAPASVLSEEDLQRLQTVQVNQEKSSRIIRAVMELLMEKGVVTREQLQQRLHGARPS